MTALDIRQELFEILGFVEPSTVFRRVTEALRKLQIHRTDTKVAVILIQSWHDDLDIKDKGAVLFMIRALELYRTDCFDEAQKYEYLAVKLYTEQQY